MICKASTTLKKTDTDGRIPAYTLDQYVRSELSKQLIEAVKPTLSVSRDNTDAPTVDFKTELVLLTSAQWQYLKDVFLFTSVQLPKAQKTVIQQLIDRIESRTT
ncbi:hypothetical protein [Spirosoma rhododendri]|uniref:Uncharacterized protein n=1 Tax=Spirosoma rhododendri TaxID=2728024 RepID=A0A7L5DTC6_9BACT|nr:hypothetical protein [Spirosoma rhododendri]QJD80543.1 hypothetical protein HH216_20580 [Spirosoma rhododendri]